MQQRSAWAVTAADSDCDSLLRTDPFLRNYSVFDWLTSIRATGSVGPTHGSGTVSTAARERRSSLG